VTSTCPWAVCMLRLYAEVCCVLDQMKTFIFEKEVYSHLLASACYVICLLIIGLACKKLFTSHRAALISISVVFSF